MVSRVLLFLCMFIVYLFVTQSSPKSGQKSGLQSEEVSNKLTDNYVVQSLQLGSV